MDWIERAYREHYGVASDVRLSVATKQFLDALRAAEPKGVRMWAAVEWRTCDAPVFHRIAHRVLIPVEVREVKEEPEPKPKTTSLMDYLPAPKTYSEEEVQVERSKAWERGYAESLDRPVANPYAAPPLDPRAMAAAEAWYTKHPHGVPDEVRVALARIIAKHYKGKS